MSSIDRATREDWDRLSLLTPDEISLDDYTKILAAARRGLELEDRYNSLVDQVIKSCGRDLLQKDAEVARLRRVEARLNQTLRYTKECLGALIDAHEQGDDDIDWEYAERRFREAQAALAYTGKEEEEHEG